ncbi:oxalyl-CoA decarboxylase [Mycobacterium tuberculosis CAS/NITR204]|uniref:Oxalyl-CoA decarboxylase n=1 Tax=Mycobacterium tuberculosis CAS/NITR204 TaxID=1310114 RepID=R4M8X5_MYCTX|nr:oxalyl-CoA decarboxylase [Mycobacterium tuberculosis CAS/NITR204]
MLGQAVEASAASGAIWRPVDPAPRLLPAPEAIDRALDVLAQAQRPLLVLGKGAAYAQADNVIREFVEHTGIPFLPMSMAKGLLPDSHPQSAAAARSLAMARADVVLLVGARLNWLLGNGESPQWSADAKFIQVDIEASEFDSNRPIVATLTGDNVTVNVGAPRSCGRTFERGLGGVDRRARRPQGPQQCQDASAVGRRSSSDAVLQRAWCH